MKIGLTSVIGSAAIPRSDAEAASGALESALHRIDIDISDLVWPGARVFLKPDLGDPVLSGEREWTDPVLIAAAARLFRRAGATVLVGDSPYADGTPVRERWGELGLLGRAWADGFTLVDLEASSTRVAAVQDTVYFVPEPVLEADLIVNLPRLRPHGWFAVAGGLTNLLGVLPGFQKTRHLLRSGADGGYGRVLIDLYAILQPGLTVLQFDLPGEEAGNLGGLVSVDGIAVDAAVAEQAGWAGGELPHVRLAAEAGLGVGWGEGIRITGEVSELGAVPGLQCGKQPMRRFFRWMRGLAEPWVWNRPELDRDLCDACDECVKSCPTKALRRGDGGEVPSVEGGICVGCWHCRAVCPSGAVEPRQSGLARYLSDSKRRNCVF